MTTGIWERSSLMALALVAGLLLALVGCTATNSNTNRDEDLAGVFDVTGSNTVTPLSTMWAEAFMNKHPNVNIAISGPGSGAGIAALIDSTTDLCQSSRLIRPSEIDQAREKGIEPYEIIVASDGLAVAVNPANPVSELTIEQLSAIYTGQFTNWKDVGGNDRPIVALARDTNSGTHVFFKEHVIQMNGLPARDTSLEYGTNVQLLPSTTVGVTETAQNVNAIFYPGLGYVTDDIKVLGIKQTAGGTAVMPSLETVLDGSYPVARPLLYYTNGEPTGLVRAFIDFCLSDEGQAMVAISGYVPVK